MKKLKKKKKQNRHRLIALVIFGVIFLAVAVLLVIIKDIPNPRRLSTFEYPESSQIFDRNDKLLYEIYTDKRRVPVALTQIPESLKQATLAIEDANFYKHSGFDFRGIIRGLFRTIFNNRLQGGSTLTQQLVKNALLTPERTIQRKIKEAVLTIATELLYNKNQILEMYFNQTPYGGTLWGVEAAANGIFNKDVKDLTLAESALIAGLPGSPTQYSPFSHPDAAKNRQLLVLKRMEELGYINKDEKLKAENETLNYYLVKNGINAPHFVFYIKEQLVEKYGLKKVSEGGLKIKTTLDLDWQKMAEETIATETAKLQKLKVSNGAALITEAKSGQILAMVGSKDYFANDIDGKYNVTTALRQPGSSIKPLNYAVALDNGKITPASMVDDSPTCFKVAGQRSYCPSNYGNNFHGLQSVRSSLANSLNIPAVKVLKLNGVETFIASASAMGISSFKNTADYGLSLTLGGGEVMMTDMITAFGVLANMGVRQDLTGILEIRDRNNKILEQYGYVPGKRVLSRESAYLIWQILSDDGARSMVFGSGSMLKIKDHPEVAVKTGTTNDMRDNWTIGYTPEYVVGTWVGNNDNSRMGGLVSGTTGAAPIWNKIMTAILKDKQIKKEPMPQGIIGLNVCNLTGKLVPDDGCESHYDYFKKEYAPTEKTALRMNILIDKDTGQPVQEGQQKTNVEWQDHNAVRDVNGVIVCLDCPAVGIEKLIITLN